MSVARRRVVVLPGDGIGPEVTTEAVRCLSLISGHYDFDLEFEEQSIGGAAIDVVGDPLPGATLDACRRADAILLGAVGGPSWDNIERRPEKALLELRSTLQLSANLRPIRVTKGLEHLSTLKPEIVSGVDVLIVRELIGGIYFGEHRLSDGEAFDECSYTAAQIETVARVAFEAARTRSRRVTSFDKANVLATSRLWRSVVTAVSEDYPDVGLEHMLVDAAAMALIKEPGGFDVILTENLFGDILSDEASVMCGSIGLLGSSSESADGPGLFEPIHGSAPELAGKDVANPAGAIASAAMLLERGLGLRHAASQLDEALHRVLADGKRTADLGGDLSCSQFGAAVRSELERQFASDRSYRNMFRSDRGICA